MKAFPTLLFAWLSVSTAVAFAPSPFPRPRTTSSTRALAALSLQDLGISDDLVPAAAVAALVLIAGAGLGKSSDRKGGSSVSGGASKSDVRIPYDAPAQLSYENVTPSGTRSLAGYERYKELYKDRSVKEVKIKVLEREVASLAEEMSTIDQAKE